MKRILSFILISCSFIGIAQSELTAASVNIMVKDTGINVQEFLILNVPDSIQTIELKTLEFEDIILSVNRVMSDGKILDFNHNVSKGLNLLSIKSNGKPLKELQVLYTVQVKNEAFYLPLFFTNLPATSSDNDFFKLNITLDKAQDYVIHFPKVDIEVNEQQSLKTLTMQVPALPSLIRMELPLSSKANSLQFIDLIDWIVALIFVIIGYFIWRNRKQLMYG